jgi:hypothetical protein
MGDLRAVFRVPDPDPVGEPSRFLACIKIFEDLVLTVRNDVSSFFSLPCLGGCCGILNPSHTRRPFPHPVRASSRCSLVPPTPPRILSALN